MRVAPQKVILLESLDKVQELITLQHCPAEGAVPRVVTELDRVDGVNVEAEQLQRKGGALVPNVAVDHVALYGEYAPSSSSLSRVASTGGLRHLTAGAGLEWKIGEPQSS